MKAIHRVDEGTLEVVSDDGEYYARLERKNLGRADMSRYSVEQMLEVFAVEVDDDGWTAYGSSDFQAKVRPI